MVVNTVTIPLWTMLGRILQVPVLVHVHEAEGSASPFKQRALALPLLLATALVANSRYSKDVLAQSFRRLAPRVSVVYNGVAGPTVSVPPRQEIEGPARLIYVGRLSPRKGPAVAIRALGRLCRSGTDAHLDIVGDIFPGYEWFEAELRALISSEEVEDRVTFHGFVGDIWPRVAASDIMIVPSQVDEPFGNTAVEAVLGARPLVVSATSGLLEAADGARAALSVPPSDPEALADSVGTILADWPRFAGLATTDAGVARARYAPERFRTEMSTRISEVAR